MPLSLLHSPPDHDVLTLAPGSRQRMREMATLRMEGYSLDEIAERYGVSRERVRQILRTHGGPDPRDVIDARRRRAGRQAEANVDELLALWRCGEAPGIAAGALGLRAAACRGIIERFATDVDPAARRACLADARGLGAQTYTDQEILTALMSVAARVGRVPSAREYAARARARASEPGDRAQPDGRLGQRDSRHRHDAAGNRLRGAIPPLDRRGMLDGTEERLAGARGDPVGARLRAPCRTSP